MSEPTFLGIGPMKSGTTTVYEYLQRHPDVFIEKKEIDWFTVKQSYMMKTDYENNFDGDYAVRGEISPNYFLNLRLIAEVYPGMKIIVTARNPIDRLVSHLRHMRSLEPTMADVHSIERILGDLRYDLRDMLQAGNYSDIMTDAYDLGLKPHIIDFNRLMNDQQEVWRELTAFLDVPYMESDYIHAHASDGLYAPYTITESDKRILYWLYKKSNIKMLTRYGINLFR
jgi:hypothetical protein